MRDPLQGYPLVDMLTDVKAPLPPSTFSLELLCSISGRRWALVFSFSQPTHSSASQRVRPSSPLWGIWQPLDDIFASCHAHDWHTWDLANSPFQISVVRSNDVYPVLHDPIDDAIIDINPFVITTQSFPPLVTSDS